MFACDNCSFFMFSLHISLIISEAKNGLRIHVKWKKHIMYVKWIIPEMRILLELVTGYYYYNGMKNLLLI